MPRMRLGMTGRAALLAAAFSTAPASPHDIAHTPPSDLFGDLFRNVADSGLFHDFKTFVDAVPKRPPSAILADYHRSKPSSGEALRQFVEANFRIDQQHPAAPAPPTGLPLLEHIARLWPHLTANSQDPPAYGSALPLPEPYVVPGGRFHELYYWDSYFTMLGFGAGQSDLRDGIIADFARELHQYGFIPNGNRTYYLSRSQPPFFFKMVALTASGDEASAYARFLPELKIEYAFWMEGADRARAGVPVRNVVRMPDGALLNRYWDERTTPRDEVWPIDVENARKVRDPAAFYRNVRAAAESGWDFSSRWLADGKTLQTIQTTDIVPADLNSILYGLERAIEAGCRRQHDAVCVRDFGTRAAQRRAAMNRYLWNGARFEDWRWRDGRRLDHVSAAAYYPLFFGVASAEQAALTQKTVSPLLLKAGGISTSAVVTGQQWDAPNGWAPLQWIAVEGLRSYGFSAQARQIACRWLENVGRVYAQSGKLLEKYDVVHLQPGGGGEYPLQDGFGWTNGVTAALAQQYPACQAAIRGR
jgi:alpha,alpha-trehalase